MKSRSPLSKEFDWGRLGEQFRRLDTQQSTDELVPAFQRGEISEPRWAPEYLTALERALKRGEDSDLLALLNDGRPCHPMLLPVLAEYLRRVRSGLNVGVKRALMENQVAFIQRMFLNRGDERKTAFDLRMAALFGVDPKTINRARISQRPPDPVS